MGLDLTVRVFFDGPGADRGITLVKEDEPGELGGKLGEPGELGGKLGEPGELRGKPGEPGEIGEPGKLRSKLGELGGPGGIANPAKLSLISFKNFITLSS